MITVFTPTYQRRSTLTRVYNSLLNQTMSRSEFEWIIVDDGSTDGTGDLVSQFVGESDLNIRYFRQPNGGKHRAWNKGVSEARGELFVFIDSDDECTPDALATIGDAWSALGEQERGGLAGLLARCQYPDGREVGRSVAESGTAVNFAEVVLCGGASWEMWHIARVDVLRRHPFPDGPKGQYVPESTIWFGIDEDWVVLDEAIRIYHTGLDGRSDQISRNSSIKSAAPGQLIGCISMLSNTYNLFWCSPMGFVKSAAQVSRFSVLSRKRVRGSINEVSAPAMRALCYAMVPVGYVVAILDSFRKR